LKKINKKQEGPEQLLVGLENSNT